MTTLAPHQQRVVDEKTELSDRLSKLLNFFHTPIFAGLDAAEKTRLRNQARFMDGYAAVLEERIAAFTEAPAKATTPEADQLRIELGRAYRCIQGMHKALNDNPASFPEAYHAPTLGAAKRCVFEGALDGSEFFTGKPVEVLHAALRLPHVEA